MTDRWEFPENADPAPEPLPARDPSGPQWPEPREPVDEPAAQLELLPESLGEWMGGVNARVAADARRAKERHPKRYCPEPECLWRTRDGSYCPRHRIREAKR